jgi:hypothetical protein
MTPAISGFKTRVLGEAGRGGLCVIVAVVARDERGEERADAVGYCSATRVGECFSMIRRECGRTFFSQLLPCGVRYLIGTEIEEPRDGGEGREEEEAAWDDQRRRLS